MADKAKRGTKRTCGSCGAKFYDLNRDPAACPICETVFEIKKAEPKPKRAPVKEVKPEPKKAEPEAGEVIIEEEDDLIDIDDDDETITPTEDDDTFLEVEDEDDNPVSAIIPGGSVSKGDES